MSPYLHDVIYEQPHILHIIFFNPGKWVSVGAEARGTPGDVGPEHGPEGVPQQVSPVPLWSPQAQGHRNISLEYSIYNSHRPGWHNLLYINLGQRYQIYVRNLRALIYKRF